MGKFGTTFILILCVIFASCTGLPLSEMSDDFKDGYRVGQTYSKRDVMSLGCYLLRQNATAHMEKKKHKVRFSKEGKSADFVSGFSMGYESHFREYVDIYCDRSNN